MTQDEINARYAKLKIKFFHIQKQPISSLPIGQHVVYQGAGVWEVISPARLRAIPQDPTYTGHLKILRLTKATLVIPVSEDMVEESRALWREQMALHKETGWALL